MSSKNYCLVSGVLFILVAIAHLARIVDGATLQVDSYMIPMWVSWLGVVFPGLLAIWAFTISNRKS